MAESEARALVKRATRIAGVGHQGSLEPHELLRVLESLASEGGRVQRIAEGMARQVLYPMDRAGRTGFRHVRRAEGGTDGRVENSVA